MTYKLKHKNLTKPFLGNAGLNMDILMPYLILENDNDNDNILLMVMMNSLTGGLDTAEGKLAIFRKEYSQNPK